MEHWRYASAPSEGEPLQATQFCHVCGCECARESDKCTAPVRASPLQCSTSAFTSSAASPCTFQACHLQVRPSPYRSAQAPTAKPAWRSAPEASKATLCKQYIAPVRRRQSHCPRYNPKLFKKPKKTKKTQVGGASFAGRGTVTRYRGNP